MSPHERRVQSPLRPDAPPRPGTAPGPADDGRRAFRHFPVSKPTMSAHFAVLREADLVHVHKDGKLVIYALKLSVLEDALLGFVGAFSAVTAATTPAEPAVLKKGTPR